ncbi:MAG: hypothetical protein EAZ58_06475, partial [Flavobacterium sp.]
EEIRIKKAVIVVMITAFFVVLMFPRKQDFYSLAPIAVEILMARGSEHKITSSVRFARVQRKAGPVFPEKAYFSATNYLKFKRQFGG